MPGTPVKKVLHEQGTVGDFTITFLTVETGNNTFNVAYSDYPAGTQLDLNTAAKGSALSARGQLTNAQRIAYRARPALDARIINVAGGQGTVFLREVAVDSRLHQLLATVDGADVKTAPAEYALMRDSLTF